MADRTRDADERVNGAGVSVEVGRCTACGLDILNWPKGGRGSHERDGRRCGPVFPAPLVEHKRERIPVPDNGRGGTDG